MSLDIERCVGYILDDWVSVVMGRHHRAVLLQFFASVYLTVLDAHNG
jgi:hypothetical protein